METDYTVIYDLDKNKMLECMRFFNLSFNSIVL